MSETTRLLDGFGKYIPNAKFEAFSIDTANKLLDYCDDHNISPFDASIITYSRCLGRIEARRRERRIDAWLSKNEIIYQDVSEEI